MARNSALIKDSALHNPSVRAPPEVSHRSQSLTEKVYQHSTSIYYPHSTSQTPQNPIYPDKTTRFSNQFDGRKQSPFEQEQFPFETERITKKSLKPGHARNQTDATYQQATVRLERALQNGFNERGDCYCQPWWCCCCNRCMKPRTGVSLVGFFDGIINIFLCGISTFLILHWELHSRNMEDGGFLEDKRRRFATLMEPNKDGLIILAASYALLFPVSWNLAHNVDKQRRWDGVLWMIIVIYASALQIVALVFFPFSYNIYINLPLLVVRVYEFWIVFRMDRMKRAVLMEIRNRESAALIARINRIPVQNLIRR